MNETRDILKGMECYDLLCLWNKEAITLSDSSLNAFYSTSFGWTLQASYRVHLLLRGIFAKLVRVYVILFNPLSRV